MAQVVAPGPGLGVHLPRRGRPKELDMAARVAAATPCASRSLCAGLSRLLRSSSATRVAGLFPESLHLVHALTQGAAATPEGVSDLPPAHISSVLPHPLSTHHSGGHTSGPSPSPGLLAGKDARRPVPPPAAAAIGFARAFWRLSRSGGWLSRAARFPRRSPCTGSAAASSHGGSHSTLSGPSVPPPISGPLGFQMTSSTHVIPPR